MAEEYQSKCKVNGDFGFHGSIAGICGYIGFGESAVCHAPDIFKCEHKQSYEFDAHGRMKYHPEIHTNHGKPWKSSDQKYLIEHYEAIGPDQMSIELGRTIHTVSTKVYELRKRGLMPKRSITKHFSRNAGFK